MPKITYTSKNSKWNFSWRTRFEALKNPPPSPIDLFMENFDFGFEALKNAPPPPSTHKTSENRTSHGEIGYETTLYTDRYCYRLVHLVREESGVLRVHLY